MKDGASLKPVRLLIIYGRLTLPVLLILPVDGPTGACEISAIYMHIPVLRCLNRKKKEPLFSVNLADLDCHLKGIHGRIRITGVTRALIARKSCWKHTPV